MIGEGLYQGWLKAVTREVKYCYRVGKKFGPGKIGVVTGLVKGCDKVGEEL